MDASAAKVSVRLKNPWLPLLLVGLVLLQATNPSRVWQYMATGILIANGVAIYWVRSLRRDINMERRLVWSWAQVGDLLEERFTLTNASWLPVLWAEVVDYSTVPGYTAARVETTGGRSKRTWSAKAICKRRGQFRLGPCDLRLGDPLGVFEVTYSFPQTQEVIVFPPIVRVSQLALPRGVATGVSRSRARTNDTTIDVASVREYRPGDVLSHVHWRTTARRAQLHVKEFDLEPSGSLWIAMDLDKAVQAGEGEESTAEYSVILAASLTYMVSRDNRPVGLYAHGATRRLVRPNVGLNHMWGLMHTFTEIEPGEGPPLAGLLEDWARMSARDATLAIITPSCDQSWLEPLTRIVSRGISTSVTLLDRTSFGAGDGGQAAMLGSLADLGVQTRVVHAGMQFEHVVPLTYRGVPRYRPGVTGRPIPIRESAAAASP